MNARRFMDFCPADIGKANTAGELAQGRQRDSFVAGSMALPPCRRRMVQIASANDQRGGDDDRHPVMLGAAAGVLEDAKAVEQRHRHHAGQDMGRRPEQDRGNVDRIEAGGGHPERAGRDRHEGADRRHETRKEHRPGAPAVEEVFALRDDARIVGQRPGRKDLALGAMADPEGRAVADHRARDGSEQHPLQLQFAAGHQRAQRQDDGRAGNDRSHHGHGFQKRGEEERQIGKPGIGRHKCNQWINIGSHKIPVRVGAGSAVA